MRPVAMLGGGEDRSENGLNGLFADWIRGRRDRDGARVGGRSRIGGLGKGRRGVGWSREWSDGHGRERGGAGSLDGGSQVRRSGVPDLPERGAGCGLLNGRGQVEVPWRRPNCAGEEGRRGWAIV